MSAVQQINLYQPIFRAQRKVFSAVALLQVCIAVAVGLLFIYGYGRWQVAGLEQALTRLQAQQVVSIQRVEELSQRFAVRPKSAQLEAEVARLEAQAVAKQSLLQSFAGGVTGNITGFSPFLEGLAKQRMEGLWLTGIDISAGGSVLILTGSTLAPELVPGFLQQLSKEPAFTGTEFKTLLMERPQRDNARVNFTLQTTDGPVLQASVMAEPPPPPPPPPAAQPVAPPAAPEPAATAEATAEILKQIIKQPAEALKGMLP